MFEGAYHKMNRTVGPDSPARARVGQGYPVAVNPQKQFSFNHVYTNQICYDSCSRGVGLAWLCCRR
jgi:hypothetical protein